MTLIKYKNPTEYSFYEWLKSYPDSIAGLARIKQSPESKLSVLIINKFYKFVKTACKNNAKINWLIWEKIETKIKKEIPILNKSDLGKLEKLFNHLIAFYKIPIRKQGYNIDFENRKAKRGNYIELQCKKGVFCEKELPINYPNGGVLSYNEKSKKYEK